MKYIAQPWMRVIISLIGGGLISELVFILTGDPNRPRDSNYTNTSLVIVVLLYFTLDYVAKQNKKNEDNS